MFNLIPWKKNKEKGGGLVPFKGNPLARLRSEFDTLFDRFLTSWPAPFDEASGPVRFWGLDIEYSEQEVVVKAEAPGFEARDLDVQVSGNLLTIKAEKKQEKTGRKGNGQFAEGRYSTFRRSVTLPPGTDADKIEARYHNGMLEVHVPKSEEAKGKRIPVKA